MRSLVLSLLLVAGLAACGGSSGAGAEPSTKLDVTVWPTGRTGPSKTHTVTCPGDSICDRLDALPAGAFDPVPAGVVCSQIYSGPQAAEVKGTLRGQPIEASFKRTDGCETARWTRLSLLLGPAR